MQRLSVAMLVFDDVEVLDFAGPFEVFSRTRLESGLASRRTEDSAPFRVFTVGTKPEIRATGGLRVLPDYTLSDAPDAEVLVVPGGFGTRVLLDDTEVLDWIRERAAHVTHLTSVCTGSLLLARAGLLKNKRATTHWGALDTLHEIDETIDVRREERVVEDGVRSSAGVAVGIDMAFTLVESLFGADVANETARYIEYPRGATCESE